MENSFWCLGNGSFISLWFDRWCVPSLFLHSDALDLIEGHSVNRFLINGSWYFSCSATNILLLLQVRILNYHIPLVSHSDKICWDNSPNGDFSLKLAYDFNRIRGVPQVRWKLIWNKYISPSISFMVWRLLHHKLPTDDHWKIRGFFFSSRCSLYGLEVESKHCFFFLSVCVEALELA